MDLFRRSEKKSYEERLAENARLVGPEMAAVRQIYPKSYHQGERTMKLIMI